MRGGVPVLNRSTTRPSALELLGEMRRGGLARAAAGDLRLGADVNAAAQERAGRDDDARRAEAPAFERLDARARVCAASSMRSRATVPWIVLQRRVLFEQRAHGAAVQTAIALRARRPDRGSLAAVEHAELQRREIGRAAHDAAECVDFAHDRAFGDAADRRIARHLADGLERARDERDARAARAPRRRPPRCRRARRRRR